MAVASRSSVLAIELLSIIVITTDENIQCEPIMPIVAHRCELSQFIRVHLICPWSSQERLRAVRTVLSFSQLVETIVV